jgi:hypothetical protein
MAIPCTFTRLELQHPFVRCSKPISPGIGRPRRTTLGRPGSPFGSPARRREDTSHRLLQPTYDTSTRRPFDSRASGFRWTDRALPRMTSERQCGAGPPCGCPTSGGHTFDDAHPTSGESRTSLLQKEGRASHRAKLPCGGVINRARGCVIRPLTPPFHAPSETRRPGSWVKH